MRRAVCCLLFVSTYGCGLLHWSDQPDATVIDQQTVQQSLPTLSNPLVIPVADRELVWNQIVDAVDDYFPIRSEQRVGTAGVEGLITTQYLPGATVWERWRHDSTPGFERLQSTLQSIRRRAEVRVLPDAGGFQAQVVVYKELEDLARPEFATVGAATRRHDGSLVRIPELNENTPVTLGWIPIGRDTSLEQEILQQLYMRLVLPCQR